MKIFQIFFTFTIAIFVFNSCNKFPENPPPEYFDIENLVANENFDWETSRDI